jgi:Iap family predicted aminopeptidase
LKQEAIIVGAHLDHVGHPGTLFPGALDNGSGSADILGAAVALAGSKVKLKRSVIFIFFGGEECGLFGSKKYAEDPIWAKEKVLLMINLDMVGNGTGFFLQGGKSYPEYLKHFEETNNALIHRPLQSSEMSISFSRPRTDSAVLQMAGYKTMNIWTTGTVKPVYYHQPLDNVEALTPEIMEDATKLLYLGILGISNH